MTISKQQTLTLLASMTIEVGLGLSASEFPKFAAQYGWTHQDKLGGNYISHFRTQPGDTVYTLALCVFASNLGLTADIAYKGKNAFAYIAESHVNKLPSLDQIGAAVAKNADGILSARPDIANRIESLNGYMRKTGISPFTFDAGLGHFTTMNLRATAPDLQTAGYAHEVLRAKGVRMEIAADDAGSTLLIKGMGRIQQISTKAFAGEPAAAMEKPPQRGFWGKFGSPFAKQQAG